MIKSRMLFVTSFILAMFMFFQSTSAFSKEHENNISATKININQMSFSVIEGVKVDMHLLENGEVFFAIKNSDLTNKKIMSEGVAISLFRKDSDRFKRDVEDVKRLDYVTTFDEEKNITCSSKLKNDLIDLIVYEHIHALSIVGKLEDVKKIYNLKEQCGNFQSEKH